MIVKLEGGHFDGLTDFPAGTSDRMVIHDRRPHPAAPAPPSLYVRTGGYDGRWPVWRFEGEEPEIRDWVI